jgi:hypothetical protein
MIRTFMAFAALVLGAFVYGTYTGASFTDYDQINNVPKSIRNNPGVYRSIYARYPHK